MLETASQPTGRLVYAFIRDRTLDTGQRTEWIVKMQQFIDMIAVVI